MQPTPTSSPTAKPLTASPTLATRPMISWPGTSGYRLLCHSLRA